MIYIENDSYSCTLYLVKRLNGPYFGWRADEPEGWYGPEFTTYLNEGDFTQTFLAPSILGRW